MITNKIVNSKFGPMIINANDTGIGRHVEQLGVWAEDDLSVMAELLRALLQKKNTLIFYDVGANIGTHSLALSKEFGDKIKIRAFEAQRLVFYQLCGNMSINGIENVHCYHLAVNDGQNKTLQIDLPSYSDSFNYGGLELGTAINSDNQFVAKPFSETVDCRALDDFDESVDFIKMDIEGMEIQALEGSKKIITESRPICFVEVLKSDILKIQDFFRSMDYLLYQYKDDDWIFLPKESDIKLNLPVVLL